MADISDVLSVLKQSLVQITTNLGTPPRPRTVIIGWPSRNQLAEGLQKGHTFISVFVPQNMSDQDITMYAPTPYQVTPLSNALIIDDGSGDDDRCILQELHEASSITFKLALSTGTTELVVGESVMIQFMRNIPFEGNPTAVHVVEDGDTIDIILQDLSDQVNALMLDEGMLTSTVDLLEDEITLHLDNVAGVVVELVQMKVLGVATFLADIQRLRRQFQIDIWAPSPFLRDLFGRALQSYFAQFLTDEDSTIYNTLMLSDGSSALAKYANSWYSDEEQAQKDFRRSFRLSIEYSVTETIIMTQVGQVVITPIPDITTPPTICILPPSCNQGLGGPYVLGLTGCVTPPVMAELEKLTRHGNEECKKI